MSNIDIRALREAAVRAGGVKWQYMRATQHSKAYITDDKGSTIVNCTDGDVPAKCAGFLESANPAAVLALLDELEANDKRNERALSLLSDVNTENVWEIIGRLKTVISDDYRSEPEIAAAVKGE